MLVIAVLELELKLNITSVDLVEDVVVEDKFRKEGGELKLGLNDVYYRCIVTGLFRQVIQTELAVEIRKF